MKIPRVNADYLSRRWGNGALHQGWDRFVTGEIRSGLEAGGGLWGERCGLGTPCGRGEGHGSRIPRLTCLDGRQGLPESFLTLQNHSSFVGYFGAYGRDVPTDIASGTGPKVPYGITIEGRAEKLGCRFHDIENVVLSDFDKAALAFRGGYRDEQGDWVECPNHGDTCRARIHVANTPIGIFIDNPQAIGSHFELHTLNVATGVEFHAGVQTAGEGYLYIGTPKATALRIVVTRKLHTWSPGACTTNWHIHRDPFPDSVEQAYTALEIEPGKLCDKCDGVSREVETVCRHCGHDKFHSDLGSDDKEFSKFRINLRLTGALPPNSTPEELVRLNGFNPEFIVVK